MIVYVVDQAVIEKYDPLGTPAVAQGIDITFCPGAARCVGEQAFVIAESVGTDALARGIGFCPFGHCFFHGIYNRATTFHACPYKTENWLTP